MGQATNVVIEKCYKGKTGESQHGVWQLYNLYFKGSDNKYSYFQSGKKPVPEKGMKISFLKFDVKVEGEYTNRTITEMVLATDQEKVAGPVAAGRVTESPKAYIDHGKCVLELMRIAEFKETRLADLIIMFNSGIDQLMESKQSSDEPTGENKQPDSFDEERPQIDEEFPPIDDADIPF